MTVRNASDICKAAFRVSGHQHSFTVPAWESAFHSVGCVCMGEREGEGGDGGGGGGVTMFKILVEAIR